MTGRMLLLIPLTLLGCSTLRAQESTTSSVPEESDQKLKTFSGRVLDLDGRPVANTDVLLREALTGSYRVPDPPAKDDLVVTRTDANGRFEFRGIPTVDERKNPKAFYLVALAQPSDATPGAGVTWKRVIEKTSDITLKARTPEKLSGVISDGNGEPIQNATVRVKYLMSIRHITQADLEDGRWPSMSDGNFLALRSSKRGPVVTSDGAGKFSFPNLPQNSGAILVVSHAEFVNQTVFVSTTKLDAKTKKLMKRRVLDGTLAVTLDPGHTVNVRVVYDDTGEVAMGASHSRFNEDAQKFDQTPFPDGTHQFTRIANGKFSFSVSPPAGSKEYLWGRGEIELSGRSRAHELTVRLPRAALLQGRFVHAETGAGLSGMSLVYRRQGAGRSTRVGVTSGPDGRFELLDRAGQYRMFVRDPGRATIQVHDVTTKIGEPAKVEFKVYPAPVYRGVVVGAEGTPVSGVKIKASYLAYENGIGHLNVVSDQDGRFELTGLFDRFYAERAMTIGDQTEVLFQDTKQNLAAIVMLDPPNGKPIPDVRVQLKQAGSISGRLIDADTLKPIVNGRVSALMYSRGISRRLMRRLGEDATTDSEGQFTVSGLIPGQKLAISFSAKGYEDVERTSETFITAKNLDATWPDVLLEPESNRPADLKPWPIDVPDVTDMSPKDAVKKLIDAHRDSYTKYRAQLRLKDRKFGRAVGNSTWQFARRVMEVVSAEPTSETAFTAYMWLIEVREFTGGAKLPELRRQAAELAVQHFADREELGTVVSSIIWSASRELTDDAIPNPLGKQLVENSPHKRVQGLSLYHTGQWILRRRGWDAETEADQKLALPLFQRCVREYADVEQFEGQATTIGKLSAAYVRDFTELAVGMRAPNIKGRRLDGEPFELADHRGEVVVFDFWSQGSWTVMSGLPDFEARIKKEFGNKIVVYGVVQGAGPKIKASADRFKFKWPIIHNGRDGLDLFGQWNVKTTPSAWVIDQRGVIAGKHLRPQQAANIAANLVRNPPFRTREQERTSPKVTKSE